MTCSKFSIANNVILVSIHDATPPAAAANGDDTNESDDTSITGISATQFPSPPPTIAIVEVRITGSPSPPLGPS